jgi:transposase
VKLTSAHRANAVSQRLATIPGVGPVTALTLAIEIDPTEFESGPHSPPNSPTSHPPSSPTRSNTPTRR